jgi:hypothetical protein
MWRKSEANLDWIKLPTVLKEGKEQRLSKRGRESAYTMTTSRAGVRVRGYGGYVICLGARHDLACCRALRWSGLMGQTWQ